MHRKQVETILLNQELCHLVSRKRNWKCQRRTTFTSIWTSRKIPTNCTFYYWLICHTQLSHHWMLKTLTWKLLTTVFTDIIIFIFFIYYYFLHGSGAISACLDFLEFLASQIGWGRLFICPLPVWHGNGALNRSLGLTLRIVDDSLPLGYGLDDAASCAFCLPRLQNWILHVLYSGQNPARNLGVHKLNNITHWSELPLIDEAVVTLLGMCILCNQACTV